MSYIFHIYMWAYCQIYIHNICTYVCKDMGYIENPPLNSNYMNMTL